jgi:arylsulfatase A-like enzyme
MTSKPFPGASRKARLILLPALSAAFAPISAHAAPLGAGTEMGIDFGNDPLPSNNFNAPAFVQTGSIAAGGIVDTTNTVVDGVGFSWTSNNILFGNSSGGNVTAGDPAVFNSSNTDDWYGISNVGTDGTITLTFSGLDDALTYDLIIGGAGGTGDATAGRADTLWTVDGQSATTRAFETDGSAYVSFTGLSTDGSGNLVMTGTGTSDFDRPDIAVVSALHLTAIDGTDATPPAWVATWPQVDGVTSSGATARGQIDEDGTAHFVVLADGATAPSAAQVKAGTDASDVAALASGSIGLSNNVEGTAAFSGLSASTAYDVYFVAEDLATNLQASPVLVEFATLPSDITAPAWVAGWPQVDSETADGATARGQIDEDGTAYYVVLADGATAPSAAQVKAGTDASDAAALAEGSIVLGANAEGTEDFGGLSAGTAYDVYFVAEDLATNLQASPVLVEFTTTPPTVLAVGTEIGIDFGPTAPSNNFNQAAADPAGLDGSIAAGDVIDTTGSLLPGVGFSWAFGDSFSNEDAADSADLPGQPTNIFNDSNLTDWIGENSSSLNITLTFTGLDPALSYDLVIGQGFVVTTNNTDTTYTADGQSATNTHGLGNEAYVSLTGLSPDEFGDLVITTTGNGPTLPDLTAVAALHLTATEKVLAAFPQTVRTEPDTPVNIVLTGSGNNLTYNVASQPAHGSLSGTEPNLTYTPSSGYIGPDSFTFTVSDGETTSDPATVSINVAEIGPNFILFLTDDQGYNDLGCYGSPHILTPRIDQLAAEGIRFTSGYVPSPVCGPCRAGLFTGSYPIRVAEPSNRKNHHTETHPNEIFIPELLSTAGYQSALIGKWHNSGNNTRATSFPAGRGPIDQGFDYFYGTPSHNGTSAVDTGGNVKTSILRADSSGTTVVDGDLDQSEADQMILNYTEEAKTFITNSHNAAEPFFLCLAHNMPHVSLGARQSFRDSAAARGLDVYTAVIEELDWSMGEILDKLDELGIADNTFVIFSTDNGPWTQADLEGYYGSAFPLRGSKMRSLEGGPRVPYIVRWPGTVTPGVVSDEIVTLMDLFPTFMDYAEVSIPGGLEIDGKSIRPLIEGTDTTSPHEYYYYYCYTQLSAIRDTRWKLVLPRRDLPADSWMSFWRKWQDRVDTVELYDLDNDLEETVNVAAQHPEVVKRLLEQVEVARAELGDKDRIGSGARFFDSNPLRPDIDAYNTSASQPYVDEPLAGLPSHAWTSEGTVTVSYDEPGTYTSVELVWALEDQGQAAATIWQGAGGGGSANLGPKPSAAPITHQLTGLDPIRAYVYRFILTDGSGTRWSIPATIDPEQPKVVVHEIGIDFSDGGNTPGSGVEPNWTIINGDGTTPTVYDSRTGNVIPGVSIQTTGASGGEMAEADLGFGEPNYGNYVDAPFSDLSANDGLWGAAGTMQIMVSGLNDELLL